VTLAHLLAFTTGFKFMDIGEYSGCANTAGSIDHPADHWPTCIAELGKLPFEFAPGTSFNYGPWHLYVAAGMAMKAFGKPLTAEAWLEVVQSKVYAPSGITEKVRYEPFVLPPETAGRQVPAFSSGLVISAQQLGKIMHALQFRNLLPDAWKERFFSAEYGANVTKLKPLGEGALHAGQWRYAQGHWIACDAAAKQNLDEKESEPAVWVSQQCSSRNPEIHHSVGMYGAYAWVDLTNNVFGVYMQSSLKQMLANTTLGIVLSIVFAVVLSAAAGFLCYWRASRQ